MQTDNLVGLNPKQREAVTLPAQSALILAGAGSGKTRVLTTRIAWLIQTQALTAGGFMAVTFTNKAANEMLSRLRAMLTLTTQGLWVGTFHGLCNRLLRNHYREANLPSTFQILDSSDQLATIKRVLKTLNINSDNYHPRDVQSYINSCKEEGLRADSVEIESYNPRAKTMCEIYAAYERECQANGVTDFAELLLRCYELLQRNDELRSHYQQRFSHILVDEFQDTNHLQYQWLKLLAGGHRVMFAVGDDDQSIYSFRGARVSNMQDFERDFAVKQVIKLEQNYRSHGHILNAANQLIKNNQNRKGKTLWTAEGLGEPIRIYHAQSDNEEASFIVEEINALVREGVMLNEIALLYRSNAQSRILEQNLFSAHIPYRVHGGLRFFERAEIKHALAYLRLISNPDDDTALLRIVNFPTRGIGVDSIKKLQDLGQGQSLWQKAKQAGGRSLTSFVAMIEHLQHQALTLKLPDLVKCVNEQTGLLAHFKNEKDGSDRVENLQELVTAASAFAAQQLGNHHNVDSHNRDMLTQFLNHASLEAGEHQANVGEKALQLMTIHAAKGLEFQVVFISGLEEGLCPHEHSLGTTQSLEEERRLLYVALTRARQRLYLSHAQVRMLHGQARYGVKSRFLEEIPDASLKHLNLSKTTSHTATSASYTPAVEASEKYAQDIAANVFVPKTGSVVMHHKFGKGTVLRFEGARTELRVQVNFEYNGTKWLDVHLAKLRPA